MKKQTSFRAIRQFCFACRNRSYISVKACPEFTCQLYMYRLGKRPDVIELKVWQEQFERKIISNQASEKGHEKRLKNLQSGSRK